jgi:hypothetical protein
MSNIAQLFDYSSGNSARYPRSSNDLYASAASANSLNSLASAETLPAGSSGLFGRPRNSGLFGKPRFPSRADSAEYGVPQVPLQHDPFLTRPAGSGDLEGPGPAHEQTPLQARGDDASSSSKGLVFPAALLMLVITVVSGCALALSFNETGYRDGYEEGHLDGMHQQSGCHSLFYWLLLQFCLDLIITGLTCIVLIPPGLSDTNGFLGCMATLRLCAVAAGFHILYLSGLQREFCNQFLITWSTIITWLGISIMFFIGFYLFLVLLRVVGGGGQKRLAPPPSQASFGKFNSNVSFG